MGKTATNISIALGLATIAFAGYYMYTQQGSTTLSFNTNAQTMDDMLNNTRVFIERRQTLDAVQLDMSFFDDERLLSLQSFSTPVKEVPVGRPDPFADTGIRSNPPVN